ncbi:hypothetical protein F6V30_14025 [Oryzomonas sagensis]|uniref:Terminase n=1 Tax=Oryzomonas sagensis TaxID=2603857 RepID=A0ABQ6TL95_9BACT|nr:hypothetical protein [Oryzomonas sagensis]KAB0668951.1 hypothetical protein F6V30_14025 [Oryzomonas sagensis]
MTPEQQKSKEAASYRHWRTKPIDWVYDKFPSVKLSSQQVWFFLELGKLVNAKIKAWNANKPGYDGPPLTDEELEYASKIGISIMAGQGVGKDFIAALTICWMLDCCPNALITATGVTGKHLRNILWREVSKVMRLAVASNPSDPRSSTVLEDALEWQTEKIFHKGAKRPGAEWFAEAVTINPHAQVEEQAKTIYGRHEDWQMIVVDEAAGCPEPIFEPLEGTLTRKVNFALMIFNPIKAKGYAYDSHHKYADKWITGRWNAEESELVTPEHLEKMARYGKDSNTYRVKVLGLPPLVSEGGFIPYDRIMDAIEREFETTGSEPVMCGVDCAGGGDKSVTVVREGPVVRLFKKQTHDSEELEDWSASVLNDESADVAFIDNIGLGWYLPAKLRTRGLNARKGDFRSSASQSDKFFNKRTECYWRMCEEFIQGTISIPNDEDLINALGAVRFETLSENRLKMPDKKEMKRKLGGLSPDEVDALALSYYQPDHLFRRGGKKKGRGLDFTEVFLR